MRSKTILLAVSLLCLIAGRAQPAKAQERSLVSLPQGGFVSLVNRSEWIDLRQAMRLQQLPAPLGAQALADTNQTIHRILRDREGRLVFGYDLWISGDKVSGQFKIAIKPLDAQLAESLRPGDPSAAEALSTFPKPTEPQTLKDGAEFSVDLLINKHAGVKFIDVVKVSFDRSSLGDDTPVRQPRDFTAEVVSMEMKDYSLFFNDELIGTGKSKTGSSGTLLWIYIPEHGRFIFSLVPRADYQFEKVGTISANKIEFAIHGDRYQWLSSSPIMHEEGTWNLWVLSDPKYMPMMGSLMAPPPKEKGTFEKVADKLDDTINQVADKAVTVQTPGALSKPNALQTQGKPKPAAPQTDNAPQTPVLNRNENNSGRSKVMYGAADKIENLLPRN